MNQKIQAIRWLGAFGRGSDIQSVASFESKPTRQVACEIIITRNDDSPFYTSDIRAEVGLKVNTSKTRIVLAGSSDLWTVCDGTSLIPQRTAKTQSYGKAIAHSWQECRALAVVDGWHTEAIIENPVYDAVVVVAGAKPRSVRFAQKLSKILNLPLIKQWKVRR